MFFIVILLGAVSYMCLRAFKFEQVSRLNAVSVPFYAIGMFLFKAVWSVEALITMVILFGISSLIGWYQAKDAIMQDTAKFDKYGRPIKLIRAGNSYIIGWFLVFIVGMGLAALADHGLSIAYLLEEFSEDVFGNLFVVGDIATNNTWYLWEISGVSNLAYTYFLERKFPTLIDAFRKPR
ncbi:hypothetical protein [Ligilactobacillus apodemi]|nr:hypothetical protein [Ligilactobacillus apodemi]